MNNKTREILILLSRRCLRRIKLPPDALYFSIFVYEFLNTRAHNIHSAHKKKKKKKKKNYLEGQTFKLLLEAKERREALVLGLGPRYFFYHYPGH